MPTLQQFRYLTAIADTLHFRRAAERTHVTQPTLSGQLRELELTLGVQLVERSRSKVLLTPIGKEIAARARLVLSEVQGIVELAKHGQTVLGGTLRLGVLHSLGPYLLPYILPELHRTYPELKLYVREAVPRELLAGLDGGSLDILLFPLPVRGKELESVPLFREPLWVAVPSDHSLAGKGRIKQSDLKGESILALETGHRLHDQVRALCEEFGAELSLDFEGTSLDTLRQMVGMGAGLSFLPALYVQSEVKNDNQVVAVEMESRPPFRLIGMVWRHQSAQKNDFVALAELIRTILSERAPVVSVVG
jgi:LysR family hydrogen peroxide-inducible transcriptional activator